MRTIVLINNRSGSLIGADLSQFRDKARSAFDAAGHGCLDITTVSGDGIRGAIEAAVRRGDADRIIVAGGDGTIRTAAQCLMGTDVALGIVPCGTLNRLARDLGLPLDHDVALSTLASAQPKAIDVGVVNGNVFLCQSMLGLPVHLAQGRQSLRGRPLTDRAAAIIRLLWDSFAWSRKLTITLDADAKRRRLRALSLAVVTGEFREEPSLLLQRERLDHGVLTLYASRHESGFAFAASFLRGLTGRFKDDRRIEIHQGQRMRIEAKQRKVVVTNDGELETMSFPLEFEIRPRALTVLIPTANAQAAA